MDRSFLKNLFFIFVLAVCLTPSRVLAMGGTVPSGYPSSFMMGLVDDDYQDALNSYGLGANAEVNTVNQYMQVTGGWDAVYRYLEGGLACTGSGWYAQYPGSGGSIPNFANLANNAGFQPVFIYYQIGAVNTSSMSSATFMGEYFQDWEQFLIQINTWMTAHSGKVVTVDIEPDMFGYIQQNGYSPTSYTVSVASATQPSCTTPWVSLSGYSNNLAGYCQAMFHLKDTEISSGNLANLKIAFHVSGWAASPNPAATSGMGAGALATHASTIATFLNACKPTSGSTWDLFFTDPSGYDGGYQATYNWDTGGAMALQYANWLNDLTADVSLRCMLWQVPEGNSKMNNVLGHYTDTRPEYFLNDSPLNTAGYSHNICLYVNSGCVGVLWGPGDYHDTDVMDFFYPANYAGSASQQDGSGNSGAGTWITPAVVDDDGGFFRTHIANNHTWGATCPLNVSNTSTYTPTVANTATATPTNTITKTFTATFTNTASNTVTYTRTNTPANTATATATFTNTPSCTYTTTFTFTVTPIATSTNTLTPTVSSTFTTAPGNTSTVTNTTTRTYTSTPSLTLTNTITSTATNTSTPGGNTPTITNTPTLTFTATASYTSTNTAANTVTVTFTPTNTNTAAGPTNTFSATVTLTSTSTPTSTLTYTSTPSFTATMTATNSVTLQSTATFTQTVTNTPTVTSSFTPTSSFTFEFTATFTRTPTITLTPTITWTPTITFTPTATTVNQVSYSPPYPNPVANGPLKVDVTTPPGASIIHIDVFTTSFRKVAGHPMNSTGTVTTVLWNLDDHMGVPVADGLYYVRITVTGASNSSKILKVMVLR